MYAKVIRIDREKAIEMLEHNTNNYRKLDKTKVNQYARKMMMGLWQENGEAIQFSKDHELLNGQHRLAAIAQANIAQNMLVVFDVESSSVYDMGKARTWTDYTHSESGKAVPTAIAGAIGVIIDKSSYHTTNEEKYEYYKAHGDDIEKAFLMCNRGSTKTLLRKAGCIAAVYCAIRLRVVDEESLAVFCKIVNSGFPENGYACEPSLNLRRTIDDGFKFVGSTFGTNCFEVTWQAIIAFKRGLKSKRKFIPDGTRQSVIDKLIELERIEAGKTA